MATVTSSSFQHSPEKLVELIDVVTQPSLVEFGTVFSSDGQKTARVFAKVFFYYPASNQQLLYFSPGIKVLSSEDIVRYLDRPGVEQNTCLFQNILRPYRNGELRIMNIYLKIMSSPTTKESLASLHERLAFQENRTSTGTSQPRRGKSKQLFENHPTCKTQHCRQFKTKGWCSFGESCRFAHGDDLRVQPSNYRTRLCRYFKNTGSCKFGDSCLFAHGQEQLREVS